MMTGFWTKTQQTMVAAALLLLLVVSPSTFVHAQDSNIVNVDCSSNLREFTALTEMVIVGRSDFLSLLERRLVMGEFKGIYNGLTTQQCDQYHRKMQAFQFLEMRNSNNETVTLQNVKDANLTSLTDNETQILEDWFANGSERQRRHRHRHLQEDVVNASSSSDASVTMLYEVQGTCRDCPLSRTGSFDLYDEGFRRHLTTTTSHYLQNNDNKQVDHNKQQQPLQMYLRTRVVSVRNLEDDDNDTQDDCVCSEGVEPTPKAPGVQECVDLMNERLPLVEESTGLLQNTSLQDLIQLDDLTPNTTDDNDNDNRGAKFDSYVQVSYQLPSNFWTSNLQGDNKEDEEEETIDTVVVVGRDDSSPP